MITIGMFGTCGDSRWRDPFIEKFDKLHVNYFNPVVPDWKEEYAAVEADHLMSDDIILFPVTGETYGIGSLSETGYSILSAIRTGRNQHIVIMIDPVPNEELKDNMSLYKESCRSRALVRAHMKKHQYQNVYIVEKLEDMLECSLNIYNGLMWLKKCDQYRKNY